MKKRLISAVIMIAIYIPILLLGDIYYIIFGSIIGLLALKEILLLNKNIPFYMKYLSCFVTLFLILYNYKDMNFNNIYGFPVLMIIFFIYSFSIIINKNIEKYNYKDALWLMTMVLMIGILFNNFNRIRLFGIEAVLYCLLISTMTDTFAYIGGKKFGKHKLSPQISPNKTVEGSIIGSLLGTIIASTYYYFVIGNINVFVLLALSFVLTIVGQIGDLFFSSIKRFHKVKDFSNLIPGHGGILDRVDSLLFVISGYLLYIII